MFHCVLHTLRMYNAISHLLESNVYGRQIHVSIELVQMLQPHYVMIRIAMITYQVVQSMPLMLGVLLELINVMDSHQDSALKHQQVHYAIGVDRIP